MRYARRRERLLLIGCAVLAACSSGDATSEATLAGEPPQLGEPVGSARIDSLTVMGHGRALAAAVADDGSVIAVTTTGVQVAEPDSGEIEAVVSFEPGGTPSMVALSSGADEVAVLDGDPETIEVSATTSGVVERAWSVPLGVVVRDLWFEPVVGRLVVETSSGPVLIEPDGAVSLDSTTSEMPTGRLAAFPDGTIVGAIIDSPDLLVVGPDGEVERRPIELRDGERLEDVRVAPDGGRVAVSASSGEDDLERKHRMILLDAGLAQIGSIETGRRLEARNWALTDSGLVAAVDTELVAWSTEGSETARADRSTPVTGVHAFGDEAVIVGQDGSIDRWGEGSAPTPIVAGGVTTVFEAVDAETGAVTTVDLFGRISAWSADAQPLWSEDVFAVGELTSLAVSSDGATIAAGSTVGSVQIFDADLTTQVDLPTASYGARVDAVSFDPGSGELVTGLAERVRSGAFDDSVTGWSEELTERFRALGDVAEVPGCSFFNARIRFDPSGAQFVAASHDFGAAVIDASTGEVLDELPGSATIVDLAFSPDGSVIVIAHEDGVVDVWDATDRSLLATYRPSQPGVGAIAILPDVDSMIVADLTGALSLIDVMTGNTLLVMDGAVARTGSIALSPNGVLIAAPMTNGTIGFWSTDSGAQVGVAPGHAGAVTALAFGPDGSRLYSASDDGTVRSWSVEIDA